MKFLAQPFSYHASKAGSYVTNNLCLRGCDICNIYTQSSRECSTVGWFLRLFWQLLNSNKCGVCPMSDGEVLTSVEVASITTVILKVTEIMRTTSRLMMEFIFLNQKQHNSINIFSELSGVFFCLLGILSLWQNLCHFKRTIYIYIYGIARIFEWIWR